MFFLIIIIKIIHKQSIFDTKLNLMFTTHTEKMIGLRLINPGC